MLKRRIKQIAKILLTLLVLLVAFLLVERIRGQVGLAAYKRQLLAKGERLSPKDFTSTVSDADNGAPSAIAAIQRLQRGVVLPDSYPPRMKMMPSGRAIIGHRESEWVDAFTYRDGEWVNKTVTNSWGKLADDLKTNAATLTEIRTSLEKPTLNNHLDMSEGVKANFTHLMSAKSLTYWLGGGSQLAMHEGRNRGALVYLLVQVRLSRLLAEDHIVISELVRIAIGAIARADTWEALQADGWTDEDLAALQKAWTDQNFGSAMIHSTEGERVFCGISTEQLRESNDDTYELLFGMYSGLAAAFSGVELDAESSPGLLENLPYGEELVQFIRKQIFCRVWRFAWSHQAQLRDLRGLQQLIELQRVAVAKKSYKSVEEPLEKLIATYVARKLYDRMRYPGDNSIIVLSKTLSKAMRAETDRSLSLSAIALKRYSLRHGKLPATLDALVPEFLPSVPVDYMDGKPVKYRLNDENAFTLYSVGEDGKDDGGDMTLASDTTFRDMWRRRDCVWPAPATPEEVEEYRRDAGKN